LWPTSAKKQTVEHITIDVHGTEKREITKAQPATRNTKAIFKYKPEDSLVTVVTNHDTTLHGTVTTSLNVETLDIKLIGQLETDTVEQFLCETQTITISENTCSFSFLLINDSVSLLHYDSYYGVNIKLRYYIQVVASEDIKQVIYILTKVIGKRRFCYR
jgi:hypothetical protein